MNRVFELEKFLLILALLFVASCGGGPADGDVEVVMPDPEEKPDLEQMLETCLELEDPWERVACINSLPPMGPFATEKYYFFQQQCVTVDDIPNFQDTPPERRFSTAPIIKFVEEPDVPRSVILGELLPEDIERLKTATQECVEALNWALPHEFGEIVVSDDEVPRGDYILFPAPVDEIYIDVNEEVLKRWSTSVLAGAFAVPDSRYIVISEDLRRLFTASEEELRRRFPEPEDFITYEHLIATEEQRTDRLRRYVCHELMHIFGFIEHPNEIGPEPQALERTRGLLITFLYT